MNTSRYRVRFLRSADLRVVTISGFPCARGARHFADDLVGGPFLAAQVVSVDGALLTQTLAPELEELLDDFFAFAAAAGPR